MSVLQTPFKIHDENVYNPSATGQKVTNSVVKKGLSDHSVIPSSSVKGLKPQGAPLSTRKALSNVSQSQINSRQTVSINIDPTTVSKSKRMNPKELAHGKIVLDEDPYDMCHRLAASHMKAGTSPLDDIRATFPRSDDSGFQVEENVFDGVAFNHDEENGGLLFP